jgi:hypothetical protein
MKQYLEKNAFRQFYLDITNNIIILVPIVIICQRSGPVIYTVTVPVRSSMPCLHVTQHLTT